MTIPNNQETSAQLASTLRAAIRAYADEVLPSTNNPAYRTALLDMFTEEGGDFMIECMRKFAAGQLKYGGNFFTADHDKEARQEHIDLFNYNAGKSMKHKYPHLFSIVEEGE